MLAVKVDQRIRDQIVVETHGNPMVLVELPRELAAALLAGGFGLPGAIAVPRDAEEMFRRRSHAPPAESRRLLPLAAAEPTSDPVLLWRAAGRLGLRAAAAQPAADVGLAEFGTRVRFRHPLVRSAAFLGRATMLTPGPGQRTRRALAAATTG